MKEAIKLLPADEKVRVIALFHLFMKKSDYDHQFDNQIEVRILLSNNKRK
jgi:hypothetical protein